MRFQISNYFILDLMIEIQLYYTNVPIRVIDIGTVAYKLILMASTVIKEIGLWLRLLNCGNYCGNDIKESGAAVGMLDRV